MSTHLSASPRRGALLNGIYAVAEYVSQPIGFLLAAPYLLRHLGATQFGVWVLASAAVNSGNILSTGFGDASVKYVAMYRGRNDPSGVARIVRGMLAINLALSTLLAFILWIVAPSLAHHVVHTGTHLQHSCTLSFRIGALLLVVRSLDSIFVSTMRAFERYSPAVRIAMCFRIGALLAAIALVARGLGVVQIMAATVVLAALTAIAQAIAMRSIAGRITLLPSLHRETLTAIASFGCFSWLQAISAAVFGQADRLIIGLCLGAPAVACYALCAQAAQTIHGTVSAGLHVLFPHLSARLESEPLANLGPPIRSAFKVNLALAVLLGSPIILLSHTILKLWMGPDLARQGWLILSILGGSFALLSLNVTAHYALLALGRVRLVTGFNFIAGAVMLLLMLLLTPRFGMNGTACARLIYGVLTCILYYPLRKTMKAETTREPAATPIAA